MSSTPLEIIRKGYERYSKRDLAGVFELLSPDIVIEQTTDLPWGGEHYGHDGARQFFAGLAAHTAATPRPEKYISAGNDIVAIGRLVGTATATGNVIDLDIVHVWTVTDGRITRFQAFIDTPGMLEALGFTS
jgi:ketosteroid isomerase-like protein